MNQFFFESRGKEKIKDLMKEGMTSQAYYRSTGGRRRASRKLVLLSLVIAGLSGVMLLIVR